ncbi:antibiotic biosynthesis monooxygenase [Motilimonas cestriensis]|uniref:Antibiotic biosynthesis monooxygenase n=1 Tax=Motilimonas cestriensis TaxID=2742685 RepID=A0ABS8W615_9GAMM|nr:antibiotic biosynthesis monooxygenase [Motilimonas cestriensis]MCE2593648.1 antibiotic biosynthesis monooxygenase [Motilimonas cestriensis]
MEQLWINATLTTLDNVTASDAYSALVKLAMETEKEPGCIYFKVLQHQAAPHKFTLWEQWVNEAALDKHFTLEHTKAYLSQNITVATNIEKLTMISE